MTRLMILTFGVLGWSWYELSGGANFEPGDTGVQLVAQAQSVEESPLKSTNRKLSEGDNGIQLARAAVGASELIDVVKAGVLMNEDSTDKTAQIRRVATESLSTLEIVSVIEPVLVAEQAALVIDNTPDPIAAPSVADSADYRVVIGNRVNMRSGPGTGYEVVNQLVLGDEVEVLNISPDGWAELRSLENDVSGWMAARFLEEV